MADGYSMHHENGSSVRSWREARINPWVFLAVALVLALGAIALKSLTPGSGTGAQSAVGRDGPALSAPDGAPGDQQALTARQRDEIEKALDAIEEYKNSDKIPQASEILTALLTKYPEDPDVLCMASVIRLFEGRTAEAYEALNHKLEKYGGRSDEYFHAGILANMNGSIDMAVAHMENACRLDPSAPAYLINLAMLENKRFNYTAAKANLIKAALLDESNDVIWGTLAEIALQENHLDIGLQHITKARNLNPSNLQWRVDEAKILLRQNQPDAAYVLLKALQPPDSSNQQVINTLAMCWAMKGDFEQAAGIHVDFILEHPNADHVESAIKAAEFFQKAGNIPQARIWVQRALNRDPSNAAATQLLEQLNRR